MYKFVKTLSIISIGLILLGTTLFGEDTRILKFGSHLKFGSVKVGESVSQDLILYNEGNATLNISGLQFHDRIKDVYEGDWNGAIEPGESQRIPITFTPDENKVYSGLVYVQSDKTNTQKERSRVLKGEGIPNDEPCTRILEFGSHLNFGQVTVGESTTKDITLYNKGTCPLTIEKLRFHNKLEGVFSGDFSGTIEANTSKTVTITFTPRENKHYNGLVYVHSDRTNSTEHSRALIGEGVDGNNRAPIANAGQDQNVSENTEVHLDGTQSNDPDGDAITYLWTLAKPSGSTAILSATTIANPTFVADIAGNYTVTLTVNDGQMDSIVDSVQITVPSNNGVNYGTVTGIVRDTDTNNVLSNVSLTINQTTVQSNGQGYFTFPNVTPENQAVIHIAKTGFVETSEIIDIRTGMNSDINIYLRVEGSAQTKDSSTDMNLTQDNFEVHIPANGLVDENGQAFSGMAHIHLTPFDPTTTMGRRAFPGDFVGIRTDGTSGPLRSFGFIDVRIVDDNGNKLNLATGINAFMRIPIPASLIASAPATTPLWWFNPVDGQWHEEGVLTKNGNYYEGDVPHFSTWNADFLYQSSFLNGRLIHCQTNAPVKCGEIIVEGNGWSSRQSCTNSDGTFQQLPVMPNTNTGVFGRKNGVRSDLYPFTSLSVGQTYDIGDICIDNPVAKITLTWEAQPQDLDAHLTFDNGNGNREMVYYGKKNANDNSIRLDTDDTDGWGPEIMTISTWNDGTYRYAVHHYSGSSDISNSGAVLNMIIDRAGNGNTSIFSLLPSAGAQGTNDVWSAWDIDIQAGQVQDIRVVDNYTHGISAGNINDFSPVP